MVLMKLRFNIDNELLATLFHVHECTVSQYFEKWIDVMFERMKPLVKSQIMNSYLKQCRCNFKEILEGVFAIIWLFQDIHGSSKSFKG